jgi:hypothetical protein
MGLASLKDDLKGISNFYEYGKYLLFEDSGKRRRALDCVLRFALPATTIESMFSPLARALTFKKPLFKGK